MTLIVPDKAEAVNLGPRRYGWLWVRHDGWTGAKTGQFRTVRHGFTSRDSALAWVRSNRYFTVDTTTDVADRERAA